MEGNEVVVEVENPDTGGKRIGKVRKVLNIRNIIMFFRERPEGFIIIIIVDKGKKGKRVEIKITLKICANY